MLDKLDCGKGHGVRMFLLVCTPSECIRPTLTASHSCDPAYTTTLQIYFLAEDAEGALSHLQSSTALGGGQQQHGDGAGEGAGEAAGTGGEAGAARQGEAQVGSPRGSGAKQVSWARVHASMIILGNTVRTRN